jgi:hypothetical protein
MLGWDVMNLWSLLIVTLLVCCQLLELFQSNEDQPMINLVQFYKFKSTQFSYKRSYGSWLWNLIISFTNVSAQIYDDCHENNLRIVELTISDEIKDRFGDLTKSYLSKIFYQNSPLKWLNDFITNESKTSTTVTVGVEDLDEVRL